MVEIVNATVKAVIDPVATLTVIDDNASCRRPSQHARPKTPETIAPPP